MYIIITFSASVCRVALGRRQQFALRPNGVNDYRVTSADDDRRHHEHCRRHYADVQLPLPRQQFDPALRATCAT